MWEVDDPFGVRTAIDPRVFPTRREANEFARLLMLRYLVFRVTPYEDTPSLMLELCEIRVGTQAGLEACVDHFWREMGSRLEGKPFPQFNVSTTADRQFIASSLN